MTFGGIKMKDAEEEEFEFGEQVETRGGGEEELYSSIDLEEENEEEDTFPGDQNSTANENQQRKRKIYDIWAEFTDQAQFEAFWDAEKAAWGCRKRHATKSSSTEFWHCRYSTRSSRGFGYLLLF
jgi:hypothetical protein